MNIYKLCFGKISDKTFSVDFDSLIDIEQVVELRIINNFTSGDVFFEDGYYQPISPYMLVYYVAYPYDTKYITLCYTKFVEIIINYNRKEKLKEIYE
jgi:hypothetical protein